MIKETNPADRFLTNILTPENFKHLHIDGKLCSAESWRINSVETKQHPLRIKYISPNIGSRRGQIYNCWNLVRGSCNFEHLIRERFKKDMMHTK